MPRKKRIIRAGFCYHVLLRGNGGQDIFRDQADHVRFCLLLQYASEQHQLVVHGFCLMSNHVHLLVQPLTTDLSSGMHALAFRYAQHFNKKYKRRGYLYQGRFKAIIVQTGVYLMRLTRYIHLNPVRANIVKCAEEFSWSSLLAYAERAHYVWLCKDLVLNSFGGSYKTLLHYSTMATDEAEDELSEIRRSLRHGAYGDEEFLESICAELSEEESLVSLSVRKASTSVEKIIQAVCDHLNVSLDILQSDCRDTRLVQARAVMAILTKKVGKTSLSTLGKKIMRDPTSLAKLAKKMELDPVVSTTAHDLSIKLTQPST